MCSDVLSWSLHFYSDVDDEGMDEGDEDEWEEGAEHIVDSGKWLQLVVCSNWQQLIEWPGGV